MKDNNEQTKMVAKPAENSTKMVKIKANEPISVLRQSYLPNGKPRLDPYGIPVMESAIVTPGNVVEVTEEEAKEFCDKTFEKHYAFSGTRHLADGDCPRHKTVRAVRV